MTSRVNGTVVAPTRIDWSAWPPDDGRQHRPQPVRARADRDAEASARRPSTRSPRTPSRCARRARSASAAPTRPARRAPCAEATIASAPSCRRVVGVHVRREGAVVARGAERPVEQRVRRERVGLRRTRRSSASSPGRRRSSRRRSVGEAHRHAGAGQEAGPVLRPSPAASSSSSCRAGCRSRARPSAAVPVAPHDAVVAVRRRRRQRSGTRRQLASAGRCTGASSVGAACSRRSPFVDVRPDLEALRRVSSRPARW